MRTGALGAVVGPAAGIAAGAAVARAAAGDTLVPWPARIRTAFPFVLGGISGAAVAAMTSTVASVATGRAGGVRPAALGATVLGASALAIGGRIVAGRVLSGIAAKGRDLDPAFAQVPASDLVSGSAASLLSLPELGREGARFVGSTATDADAKAVTGKKLKKAPIRVFVGFDAAATPEQRVGLAMAELRRTGAFERKILIIESPAGTGYSNPTPADVTEILSGGDCAVVSVAYGVMPSFLSIGPTTIGRAEQTQRLLVEAVAAEVKALGKKRPTLLLYGESLGAKVLEAAIPRGPVDMDELGITAALFVGTPGGADSDTFHAACRDVSWTVDNPSQLPAQVPDPRPRVWFLEHDGDPVVRVRPELLTERPGWLPTDGERGRNVPASMTWRPGVTWAQVLVDTLFATNVKPGDFKSLGHDYRADLGPVVAMAFGFDPEPAVLEALDVRLRAMEVERAQRIAETPGAEAPVRDVPAPELWTENRDDSGTGSQTA